MFSDKVICAIMILMTLKMCPSDAKGRHALSSAEILNKIGVERGLYRWVRSELTKAKLIESVSQKCMLCKDVAKITLMDLMQLLHHGIPLGNPLMLTWNKGNYYENELYVTVRSKEEEIFQRLRKDFESVRIFELIEDTCN